MADKVLMGYEGIIYHGTAGSTAATEIVVCRDFSVKGDHETDETTHRSSGGAKPRKTVRVHTLVNSIEFEMLRKQNDAPLAALLTAANAGTPVAIRTLNETSGLGFDGDCVLTTDDGKPFKGVQTIKFTAMPTSESGRTPQDYV